MQQDLHSNERQKMIKDLAKNRISKRRKEIARTIELITVLDKEDWEEIKDFTF
jgi:hypothetical protein